MGFQDLNATQLVDVSVTAELYRVSASTIRSWRRRSAEWLPEPIATLNGGAVWLRSDIEREAARYHRGADLSPTAADGARRRALGSYYTSTDTAHFLAEWLLANGAEKILEPSFGDGVFITATNEQARRRGLPRRQWIAAELDEGAVRNARSNEDLFETEIRHGNFLSLRPEHVDAVIANPPYVRLRNLDNASILLAQEAVKTATGAPMSPAGSIWLPFLIHSTAFLRTGGSLAMVLPSDFTYVAYARKYWAWLAEQFDDISVVRVRERLFPDINQDVLLLLCKGKGGHSESVNFTGFETVLDLVAGKSDVDTSVSIAAITSGERVFQRALAGPDAWDMLEGDFADILVRSDSLMRFRIGYVAGDKRYFHPDANTVSQYSLPSSSLTRTITNARRLRGAGIRTSLLSDDIVDRLWLPREDDLSAGELEYIAYGEKIGVSSGYKAQLRKPWFRVPTVQVPDVVLTVFSENPLLLLNDAKLQASNSLLCGYSKGLEAENFALDWYSPVTQLSVATEVHSLGGGVMILVPNEANSVKIARLGRPGTDINQLTAALEAGDVHSAYQTGRKSLSDKIGNDNTRLIDNAIERLRRWRVRS